MFSHDIFYENPFDIWRIMWYNKQRRAHSLKPIQCIKCDVIDKFMHFRHIETYTQIYKDLVKHFTKLHLCPIPYQTTEFK